MWAWALATLLVQPNDVLEQRELLLDTRIAEVVTARAHYRLETSRRVLLPAGVQGVERPQVFVAGQLDELAPERGPQGWEVEIPRAAGDVPRVMAMTTRTLNDVVLFQLVWPRIVPRNEPTRRVLSVPRRALRDVPPGWTCPADGYDITQCVSSRRRPDALTLRIDPRGSRAFEWAIAAAAMLIASVGIARWARRAQPRERIVGASIGAAVGGVVALALVGAHWVGWAAALAACMPVASIAGGLATRSRAASTIGVLALLGTTLAVSFGVRIVPLLGIAVSAWSLTLMSALFLRALPRRQRSG